MASTQKKYIGLLGGSFDPAHKGHLSISNIAIKSLKLKKIYWVITKKNPFKNKTFYSLDARIKYAKKISKPQKKIKVIYLDNIIKSSRIIYVINYFIKNLTYKFILFISLFTIDSISITLLESASRESLTISESSLIFF